MESISAIITYFSSNLPTNDLMKYSLELLQLEVGWDEPILLIDYNQLYYFYTDGWMKSV